MGVGSVKPFRARLLCKRADKEISVKVFIRKLTRRNQRAGCRCRKKGLQIYFSSLDCTMRASRFLLDHLSNLFFGSGGTQYLPDRRFQHLIAASADTFDSGLGLDVG